MRDRLACRDRRLAGRNGFGPVRSRVMASGRVTLDPIQIPRSDVSAQGRDDDSQGFVLGDGDPELI